MKNDQKQDGKNAYYHCCVSVNVSGKHTMNNNLAKIRVCQNPMMASIRYANAMPTTPTIKPTVAICFVFMIPVE